MSQVEIVAIGRELVTGLVADTNSAWLAAQLTALGATVSRMVVVDDDPAAIAHEIRAAHGLVITTGGLGPTLDDRTLAGIAAARGTRLVEHPDAVAFVARRYAELAAAGLVADGALTPPRRKMARLPEGAELVDNPVGTAPGVFMDGIVALPGVPDEMRAVFAAALPRIRAYLGPETYVAEREIRRRSRASTSSRSPPRSRPTATSASGSPPAPRIAMRRRCSSRAPPRVSERSSRACVRSTLEMYCESSQAISAAAGWHELRFSSSYPKLLRPVAGGRAVIDGRPLLLAPS
jgi:molybdenum cofactor synthesis domain-containing protein